MPNIDPITATLVLAALAVLAALQRRFTRRGGFRARRWMEDGLRNTDTSAAHGHSLHHLVSADALSGRRLQRLRSHASRLRPVALSAVRSAAEQQQVVAVASEQRDTARDGCVDEPKPVFTTRAMTVANGVLLLGDLAVVSMAIMASDGEVTPLAAIVASFALSLCVFFLGKVAGDRMKDLIDARVHRWLAATAGFLVVFSLSLVALRADIVWAWVILTLAPAVAAAGLTLLGPTRPRRFQEQQERELRRQRREADRRLRRAARLVGRHNSVATAANQILAAMEARVLSVMALHTGLDEPNTVRDLDTLTRQRGVRLDLIEPGLLETLGHPATEDTTPAKPVDELPPAHVPPGPPTETPAMGLDREVLDDLDWQPAQADDGVGVEAEVAP